MKMSLLTPPPYPSKTTFLHEIGLILYSFLTEMGEIIRTTTERGGRTMGGNLIDTTFKYCPTFFMQVNTCTIHGMVNGHYMSLVYCLFTVPNKTQDTYHKMWTDACIEFLFWHPMPYISL